MIRGGLVTLVVRDLNRAVRFYVETLGMKLVDERGKSWAVIDAGDGFRIGLSENSAVTEPTAATGSIGFFPKLPIADAIAMLANRGIHFDVKRDGPVTHAHFRDPDNNALYLRQEH